MARTNRYLREIPLPGFEEGPTGYRAPKVTKLVGITYRQLDYWTSTGLVRASVRDADGSGSQRLYSFEDIVQLRVIKRLLDTGVGLKRIRAAIDYIRDRGLDLRSITLVSDGKTIYALDDESQVVDLLQRGQGVFAIALEPVVTELEGDIAVIEPEPVPPVVEQARDPEAATAGDDAGPQAAAEG